MSRLTGEENKPVSRQWKQRRTASVADDRATSLPGHRAVFRAEVPPLSADHLFQLERFPIRMPCGAETPATF